MNVLGEEKQEKGIGDSYCMEELPELSVDKMNGKALELAWQTKKEAQNAVNHILNLQAQTRERH